MNCSVVVKEPVYDFARNLAPEPRRAVRRALAGLRTEQGDIREFEGSLSGHCRLRIGKYRLIFRYVDRSTIEAIFLEERSIVYEVFAAELLKKLTTEQG
jgi:mRNA-degrading endonuclease RelE of RelBE toxin-antitoxin system